MKFQLAGVKCVEIWLAYFPYLGFNISGPTVLFALHKQYMMVSANDQEMALKTRVQWLASVPRKTSTVENIRRTKL